MRCGLFLAAAAISLFSVSSALASTTITYLTTWADIGGSPCGIDVDAGGNVYVTRASGNDVLKYDSSGALLQTISGSLGIPTDIDVSHTDGSMYVTNVWPNAICVKYAADGIYSTQWSTGAPALSVTTDSSGNVYIADVAGSLKKYDPAGTVLDSWTIPAGSGLTLNANETIAYTTANDFHPDEADPYSPNRFFAIDLSSGNVTPITTRIDTWDRCSIDVNTTTGNIYLASRTADFVQEFAGDGTLIREWNTWTTSGSEATYSEESSNFSSGFGIAVNSATNMIYVCDQVESKVMVFK